MTHLGLFEGIGGFSLAAKWMGWETVAWVENNEHRQKLLTQNSPNAKGHGCIKQFDGAEYFGTIDVITGGFPCQTFSMAGKGAVDLSLWKEMLRVVGEVRPSVVVAENVYGILARKKGMALTTVYDDLENEGYTTMPPLIIPACATGAWHRRDRVWIVAYSDAVRCESRAPERNAVQRGEQTLGETFASDHPGVVANLESEGRSPGRIRRWDEKSITESDHYFRATDWGPWSTEPLVGGRLHGIPHRVDRIEGLGNAIYPAVAYEIFKAIETVFNQRGTEGNI